MTRPVVCSIGTSDPWNAAGLGLDARIIEARGGRAVTVIAAVSAQDEGGIRLLMPLDDATIHAQWTALSRAGIAAVRVGALPGATVHCVAHILAGAGVPVVYDPVLRASRGGAFTDEAGVAVIRSELLPNVSICTPNLSEAAKLTGRRVSSVVEMESAANALRELGAGAALVTGGHLDGDPIDVLSDGTGTARFVAPRLDGDVRGTGCLLAAALCVEIARGAPLRVAVERARAFVRSKIAGAVRAGDFYVAE